MIPVALMINSSDNNVVDKALTVVDNVDCLLKDTTELVDPVIRLSSDNITSEVNYCYIPRLGRYYYIRNKKQVVNGMCELELHVDVLTSFASEFRQLNAIVNKTELNNVADLYIDDGSFLASADSIMQVVNFENGFNDTPEYILLTAGG